MLLTLPLSTSNYLAVVLPSTWKWSVDQQSKWCTGLTILRAIHILVAVYTLLRDLQVAKHTQRRMRWLGHVTWMKDGRIPKDLLYSELATGKRPTGWPQLRFKNVCKWDLQAFGINTDYWEVTATDRDAWRHSVKLVLWKYEETQRLKAEEKRLRKKSVCLASRSTTVFTCSKFGSNCHFRINLHSHNRRCTMGANLWSFETDRCQWFLSSAVPSYNCALCRA